MVRKGRVTIDILINEDKISATLTKIKVALTQLLTNGDIESANGKIVYEEVPEDFTI